MSKIFKAETALCRAFINWLPDQWTAYPETAGYDIMLVHDETGHQIGVEAKLRLNAEVIEQAVRDRRDRSDTGPDFRAVLVPRDVNMRLKSLCRHLGVTVLRQDSTYCCDQMPKFGNWNWSDDWFDECPTHRMPLPEYIPRVEAGASSPRTLSSWAIRSMKLLIILERRGYVTRADFRALTLSPSSWATSTGYLTRGPVRGRWVASEYMPDLRGKHPETYAEIEADEGWQGAFDFKADPDQETLL